MLKLYNTMSGIKEVFKSNEEGKVKIFSCGPSVYRRPHIGNYRTFLYEDLLIKYLKYLGYKVKYTTILTDIEDKTISEAIKVKKNIKKLTGDISRTFFNEAKLLKISLPDPVPRATTGIEQTVLLIKKLMATGHAYRYNEDIFFDPLKYKDFGKLFKLDIRRWPKKKVRFKKDTYNGRRWNLGDFILWHGYKNRDIISWDTEIGKGRPSWNIEDPAIITKHLGYKIDINCGGIDNIYRHHDYNIAIIESVSGENYANYYLHGEHLIVNGKSMSKSRGNILYPEDVLKNNYKAYHLRFFLLYNHYRKKLNFTDEKYKKTSEYIDAIRLLVKQLINKKNITLKSDSHVLSIIDRLKAEFEKYMNNDLEFGAAIDSLYINLKEIIKTDGKGVLDSKSSKTLFEMLRKFDSFAEVIF